MSQQRGWHTTGHEDWEGEGAHWGLSQPSWTLGHGIGVERTKGVTTRGGWGESREWLGGGGPYRGALEDEGRTQPQEAKTSVGITGSSHREPWESTRPPGGGEAF